MASENFYLLIDNSNSFTKFGWASATEIMQTQAIPTVSLSEGAINEVVKKWEFERVVLSSVVPEKRSLFEKLFTDRCLLLTHECSIGIAIDYPEPAKIGGDRLANAVAVSALYGVPAIVIDFGTAVTFDILSEQGAYIGGVITPGLEVMTDYLHEKTSLLPRVSIEEPSTIVGKSTEQAMLTGVVIGFRGLIQEVLKEIIKEQRFGDAENVSIIATGGYAELISRKIPIIDTVHPHLTLEGLRIIGNLNR